MKISAANGFTLPELLAAVAMAAILATIAIPSFVGMVRESRMDGLTNQLVGALNLARSEAAKGIPGVGLTIRVAVCKAQSAVTPPACDTSTCDEGSGNHCWDQGWLVFRDPNGNGIFHDGDDKNHCGPKQDCTIAAFPALPTGLTLRTGTNTAKWIAFEPDGSSYGSNGLVNDTFRLCRKDDTEDHGRSIIILGGRIRSQKGAPKCP